MPGEEVPPNPVAAQALAYTFNIFGQRTAFLDQFPVIGTNDKVQKFCNTQDKSNLSIRYDDTQFGG